MRYAFQLKGDLPVVFARRTAAPGLLLCLFKTNTGVKAGRGKITGISVKPGYLPVINLHFVF